MSSCAAQLVGLSLAESLPVSSGFLSWCKPRGHTSFFWHNDQIPSETVHPGAPGLERGSASRSACLPHPLLSAESASLAEGLWHLLGRKKATLLCFVVGQSSNSLGSAPSLLTEVGLNLLSTLMLQITPRLNKLKCQTFIISQLKKKKKNIYIYIYLFIYLYVSGLSWGTRELLCDTRNLSLFVAAQASWASLILVV